jgi:O-antigen/teichoic acid export membrane protein
MTHANNDTGLIWSQAVSAIMSVIQVFATITLSAILARMMTSGEFGTWASVTAALTMLAIISQMGLPDLLTKETAVSSTNRAEDMWSTWIGIDRMLLPSLGIAMMAAAIVLPWMPGTPWNGVTLAVLLLHIPCLAFIALRAGAIRGLGLGNAAQFLTSIMSSILTITIILGVIATGTEISLTIAFSASLISLAVPLVFTQFIRDFLAPSPRHIRPLAHDTRRALRRASLPMAGVAGLTVLNSQTDVLMLSWLDSPESAGLYQIAIQTAMVLAIIRSQLGLAASGRIAALWATGNRVGMARASRSIALLSTMVASTCFFLSLFFGETGLAYIFGDQATASAPILSMVCAAWAVASFFGIPGYCLMMSGHQDITLKASAISFAINAMLNPVLIPLAGINGAAFTLMASVFFWHSFLWWQVRRKLDFDCSILSRCTTVSLTSAQYRS